MLFIRVPQQQSAIQIRWYPDYGIVSRAAEPGGWLVGDLAPQFLTWNLEVGLSNYDQ